MRNSTINLEDTPSFMDIFRFAGEQAAKGFTADKTEKIDTPCEFFRKNKLSSFRLRTLKNGSVRLSVITSSGAEHYAIHNNFVLAYIRLVRSYSSITKQPNHERCTH